MRDFVLYIACWDFAISAIYLIVTELCGIINKKLKKRNCTMKKKKLSSFQKYFYLEMSVGENKNAMPCKREGAVYDICYKLARPIYISLVVNICAIIVELILRVNVLDDMTICAIVHSSVFGAFYLAMLIISIVTLRKAFKSCPKD